MRIPVHTCETGTFRYHGHRLGYEIHGSGRRVIVLLHGLLLDANINRGLAHAFAEQGYRVVLLDLLGHGTSEKPADAALHRFDRYARQVVALLDHLGVERAVVGGLSLGADVALQVATIAPERVAGLIAEMPVMENATPFAALLFVPLLLGVQFGGPVARLYTGLMRRIPRPRNDLITGVLNTLSTPPEAIAAVLHGILVGPVAPEIEQRRAISAPTLVIGHERDLLHPFTDAVNLAEQIPGASFLQANSILELRTKPARLLPHILDFLDGIDFGRAAQPRQRAGAQP
ncbi:MAG: alpha/beta hydrolase [Gammaproteobacteria bacterium]|nr:alpha/beta hydrolase [Gammaproteobacteria bacterium]